MLLLKVGLNEILKYKLLKKMLNYKLLKGHFYYHQNLVRIILYFYLLKRWGSRTYLGDLDKQLSMSNGK